MIWIILQVLVWLAVGSAAFIARNRGCRLWRILQAAATLAIILASSLNGVVGQALAPGYEPGTAFYVPWSFVLIGILFGMPLLVFSVLHLQFHRKEWRGREGAVVNKRST